MNYHYIHSSTVRRPARSTTIFQLKRAFAGCLLITELCPSGPGGGAELVSSGDCHPIFSEFAVLSPAERDIPDRYTTSLAHSLADYPLNEHRDVLILKDIRGQLEDYPWFQPVLGSIEQWIFSRLEQDTCNYNVSLSDILNAESTWNSTPAAPCLLEFDDAWIHMHDELTEFIGDSGSAAAIPQICEMPGYQHAILSCTIAISDLILTLSLLILGRILTWTEKLRHLLRPRLRSGHSRLEWTCICGQAMYGDYEEIHPGSLEKFSNELAQLRYHVSNLKGPEWWLLLLSLVPRAIDSEDVLIGGSHCWAYYRSQFSENSLIVAWEVTHSRYSQTRVSPGLFTQVVELLVIVISAITPHLVRWLISRKSWREYVQNDSGRLTAGNLTNDTKSTPMASPTSERNTAPVYNSSASTTLSSSSPADTYSSEAMPSRRYFELCVNTSSITISLGEINLNTVQSDAQLFELIHKRYYEIRGHRRLSFLYKPVDIQFVRFSIYDGGRVGIYDRPLSIPPKNEVLEGRYHYHECPLDPLPPIDHRTFFHYFRHHKSHAHTNSRIFINRLPKKLNVSMREQHQPDQLNLGWGVHIIEGPNKAVLSLFFCFILTASSVVSLVYSVIRDDEQTAFGIAQWMVATLTAGLTAVYFHLSE